MGMEGKRRDALTMLQKSRVIMLRKRRDTLILMHALKCGYKSKNHNQEGSSSELKQCNFERCDEFKTLISHSRKCYFNRCFAPKCGYLKDLVRHFHGCPNIGCFICAPVNYAILKSKSRFSNRTNEEEWQDVDSKTNGAPKETKNGEHTTPSTIALETKTTPFMQVDVGSEQKFVGKSFAMRYLDYVRRLRTNK